MKLHSRSAPGSGWRARNSGIPVLRIKDKAACFEYPRLQRPIVRLMLRQRAAAAPWPPFPAANFLIKAIEIFAGPNENTGLLWGIILYCLHWSNGMLEETEDSGMSRMDSRKEEDK